MGEADRYTEYRQPRRKFTLGADDNALVNLVAIHIIVFLLLMVIQVTYFFFQLNQEAYVSNVVDYFALPAQLKEWIYKPWTLLAYMFSDIQVFHLLGNLLWLWAFGYIFQELTGSRRIIPLFIYGGFWGGLVFVLSYNFIPVLKAGAAGASLLGGNAGIMAVAVATTVLAPDYRFFRNLGGGVPIWVLILIYLLIDFAGVATLGAAYSLSHIAGGLAGLYFSMALRNGKDPGSWMVRGYNGFMNLFTPPSNRNSAVKGKVFYNTGSRPPYQKFSNVTQQRVDEILDKINQKGYKQLTEEERTILRRASEEGL